MKQLWMWTSLLAGGLLLSGCGASPAAHEDLTQAQWSPITLAQATPPVGYEFVHSPERLPSRMTFRDGQPISELAPVEVRPQGSQLSMAPQVGMVHYE